MSAKPPTERRRGGILHEKDGDFNPGWALVIGYGLLGVVGVAIAFFLALTETAPRTMLAFGFGFICFMVITAATMVVSVSRAKILNESKVLQKLGGIFDVDERDEEQRARGD